MDSQIMAPFPHVLRRSLSNLGVSSCALALALFFLSFLPAAFLSRKEQSHHGRLNLTGELGL